MQKVIEAIGQRIKELRSQKNLTLEELAERSGCTPGFLSQIERNRAVPSIATLDAIAGALDTRVSDFFPDTIKTAKIVRHNQRETFQFEGSSTIYSILSTKFLSVEPSEAKDELMDELVTPISTKLQQKCNNNEVSQVEKEDEPPYASVK